METKKITKTVREFKNKTGYTLEVKNDKLHYGSSLNLEGTGITSLPENLVVGGYLDLRGTGIASLPDNLTVSDSLYLQGTGITSLPENLVVGGSLYLDGTGITSLPENLIVGVSLNLEGTGITSLPENLVVGGSLYLQDTGITSLPDNLTVGGSLYLEGTGITSLPENLVVGGSLYLQGTDIISLPDNLTVGLSLHHEDTGITDTSKVKRNVPDLFQWRNYGYIKADGIFSKVISHRGDLYKISQIGKAEIEYLVTDGDGKWSYGDTLKQAKADLIYKISNRDKSKYENLTLDSELTFAEAIEAYRVITGVCANGTKMFIECELMERKEKYTIAEIIFFTYGQYNNEVFKAFFDRHLIQN